MSVKRMFLIGIMFIGAFLVWQGCLEKAEAKTVVLRHASALTLEWPNAQAILAFERTLDKMSNGRIKIEHFLAGQLGGMREMIKGQKGGTIDLAGYGSLSTIAGFEPKIELGALPYLFDTVDEVKKYLVDGWMGKLVEEYALSQGIRILSPTFAGWMHYYLVKPVKKASDLTGMKIRIQESPMYLEYFKKLGVIPTPIPWAEVYSGLQMKTFDGLNSNLDWGVMINLHEPVPYIVPLKTNYMSGAFTISEKRFKSFDPKDQKIILEAAKCFFEIDAAAVNVATKRNTVLLKKMGKNLEGLPANEMAKLRKKSIQVIKPYIKKTWGNDILSRLEKEVYSK